MSRTSFSQLSTNMKQLLLECYERKKNLKDAFEAGTANHPEGLIRRGLVEARKFITRKGKELYGIFVTDKGRQYVNDFLNYQKLNPLPKK